MFCSWWSLILYCIGAFSFFKTGKYFGFCEGLKYFRKNSLYRSEKGKDHFCNIPYGNVVCFEREGELWVKEYCNGQEKEMRTYMVFYCPWCGYQSDKSKIRYDIKAHIDHTVD